jgi:hypothetical protein
MHHGSSRKGWKGLKLIEREMVVQELERRESESDFPNSRESSHVTMKWLGPNTLIYSLCIIIELSFVLNVPNSILITELACNYEHCII